MKAGQLFRVENILGEAYHFPMDIQAVKDQIIPIIKKYHVSRASLFGSIVTGVFHKQSDIDILVELPHGSSLMDRARVKVALEEQFGRKVDVLNFHGIKDHAKQSILSSQVAIFP